MTPPASVSRSHLNGLVAACLVVTVLLPGCVRRTMTITTDPPNARVYINDEDVGRSAVAKDFLWYGDYRVTLRKEGYATVDTNWKIEPPWYQVIPLDFVAEVLWPGQLHDQHTRHFELEPATAPSTAEILSRAEELRTRALDVKK